jgi:hypothetical protein
MGKLEHILIPIHSRLHRFLTYQLLDLINFVVQLHQYSFHQIIHRVDLMLIMYQLNLVVVVLFVVWLPKRLRLLPVLDLQLLFDTNYNSPPSIPWNFPPQRPMPRPIIQQLENQSFQRLELRRRRHYWHPPPRQYSHPPRRLSMWWW